MTDNRWLTPKEAAAYLGRTSKTAWRTLVRYAREGKIRAGHDGRTFRFRTEDIDAYLYLNGKEEAQS